MCGHRLVRATYRLLAPSPEIILSPSTSPLWPAWVPVMGHWAMLPLCAPMCLWNCAGCTTAPPHPQRCRILNWALITSQTVPLLFSLKDAVFMFSKKLWFVWPQDCFPTWLQSILNELCPGSCSHTPCLYIMMLWHAFVDDTVTELWRFISDRSKQEGHKVRKQPRADAHPGYCSPLAYRSFAQPGQLCQGSMSGLNAEQPEGLELKGSQYWFSPCPFAPKGGFSRISSCADIIYCEWWDIQSSLWWETFSFVQFSEPLLIDTSETLPL